MPPKKDPNKPKGRTSAYAFFVKERRNEYKAKGQEVDFTAFSRECSELWKDEDDPVDKTKFQKLADADKRRYDREMMNYVPPDGIGKKRSAKKTKDPNAPKRAMSAFFLFGGEKRAEIKKKFPGATVGEVAKHLGAEWKKLSEKEKKPYEDKHEKLREQYARDMTAYKKGEVAAADEDDDEEYSDED